MPQSTLSPSAPRPRGDKPGGGSPAAADTATLSLISVDAALEFLLSRAAPVTETEQVPTLQSLGRVLAAVQISPIDVPPSDNSGMDGYAVSTRDLATAGETRLAVSQRIPAGKTPPALQRGTAARIFTGASIPVGADAVVMQECCRADGDAVIVCGPVQAGENVRRGGEDITAGEPILRRGIRIRPQEMGLAASVGLSCLPVYRRARVAVFSTGDELCEPGESLGGGRIYNSNRYTLHGLLRAMGCDVLDLGIVADDPAATRSALLEGARKADLILSSGGVSVGEEDHVKAAVEELGSLDLWRIAIKPGKPLAFGCVGATPFLGLPGNPVSAFVTFCLFARPYALRLQGMDDVIPATISVRALFNYRSGSPNRSEYLRARLDRDADGLTGASIHPHQGSGVLTSTTWATGLLIVPEGKTVQPGEALEFLPFNELLA
jgi:molybdopterin molybdotransferase